MIDLFCTEVRDYEGLRAGIAARIDQLDISRECLDQVAGLTSGHAGKLLAPCPSAKDAKRFGMITLGLVLQAAGLKILLVDDREALARVEPMFERRDALQVRSGHFWKGGKRKRTRPKKAAGKRKTAALWHSREVDMQKQAKRALS